VSRGQGGSCCLLCCNILFIFARMVSTSGFTERTT
jgi:hypothetical protein